jgi:hypothetical protein
MVDTALCGVVGRDPANDAFRDAIVPIYRQIIIRDGRCHVVV